MVFYLVGPLGFYFCEVSLLVFEPALLVNIHNTLNEAKVTVKIRRKELRYNINQVYLKKFELLSHTQFDNLRSTVLRDSANVVTCLKPRFC